MQWVWRKCKHSKYILYCTHLVPQRTLPLEEMLDSEAQRRRGSGRRGDREISSSSSTTKPFAIPKEVNKTGNMDLCTSVMISISECFVTREFKNVKNTTTAVVSTCAKALYGRLLVLLTISAAAACSFLRQEERLQSRNHH